MTKPLSASKDLTASSRSEYWKGAGDHLNPRRLTFSTIMGNKPEPVGTSGEGNLSACDIHKGTRCPQAPSKRVQNKPTLEVTFQEQDL